MKKLAAITLEDILTLLAFALRLLLRTKSKLQRNMVIAAKLAIGFLKARLAAQARKKNV